MVRRILFPVLLAACATGLLSAATLEKLSLEEMIDRSTEIVRGRVISATVLRRGPVLFTTSRIQVTERLKGPGVSYVDVAVPGGTHSGLRQVFSGAPALESGGDYVVFIWTGQSGVRQIIGFSQGLFDVKKDSAGEAVVMRAASTEVVLDSRTGRAVEDSAVRMPWKDLRDRVKQRLGALR